MFTCTPRTFTPNQLKTVVNVNFTQTCIKCTLNPTVNRTTQSRNSRKRMWFIFGKEKNDPTALRRVFWCLLRFQEVAVNENQLTRLQMSVEEAETSSLEWNFSHFIQGSLVF